MSLFNLSAVIDLLSNATVDVEVPAPVTYDNKGNANDRAYGATASGVKASVQPIRGTDLAKLPEGELVTEWFTVYANTPMPVGARVTVSDGRVGECRVGNDWQSTGTYSKAFVKKFAEGEPRP